MRTPKYQPKKVTFTDDGLYGGDEENKEIQTENQNQMSSSKNKEVSQKVESIRSKGEMQDQVSLHRKSETPRQENNTRKERQNTKICNELTDQIEPEAQKLHKNTKLQKQVATKTLCEDLVGKGRVVPSTGVLAKHSQSTSSKTQNRTKNIGGKEHEASSDKELSTLSKLLHKRCQSAPSTFKSTGVVRPNSEPSPNVAADDKDNKRLTMEQITKINQFYLAKQRSRLLEQKAKENARSKNIKKRIGDSSSKLASSSDNYLADESRDSFPGTESLRRKVNVRKVLLLQNRSNRVVSAPVKTKHRVTTSADPKTSKLHESIEDFAETSEDENSDENNEDSDLSKGRKLKQMPRIYEVYLAAKERFADKAKEARMKQRKSDTSLKSTGTETSSYMTSSFVDSDSDSDDETDALTVSFRDPLETYLWRTPENDDADENKEKKDKRKKAKKKKKARKEKQTKDEEVTNLSDTETITQELSDTHIAQELDTTQAEKESQDTVPAINVYLPNPQDSVVSFFTDTSEDAPTNYITAPTYSLSLNTAPRNADGSFVTEIKVPRAQTVASYKPLAFTRTDTTAYQNIPGHWNYASDAIPIAQYIRAVESGIAVDGFIEPVSELKIPFSTGTIRRQRQEMVLRHDKIKKVNTDLEKARMKEIQNRIGEFLQSLPKAPKQLVI